MSTLWALLGLKHTSKGRLEGKSPRPKPSPRPAVSMPDAEDNIDGWSTARVQERQVQAAQALGFEDVTFRELTAA